MASRLGERDWRERTTFLRREAHAGNVAAVAELGQLLQQGIQDEHGRAIVRRNPRAGFQLLLRAAANGDTSVAFPLGYAYEQTPSRPRGVSTSSALEARACPTC